MNATGATSSSGENLAYLSLGSNIEPEQNLPAAVRLLGQFGDVVAVSQFWESEPWGGEQQAKFLNAAVLLKTALSARHLKMGAIAAIEVALKRRRIPGNKNAPRTIDIDISLFNAEVFLLGKNRVPDPEILTRCFVAVPLAEIAPDYRHPETGQTLAEIAAELKPQAERMTPRVLPE